MADHNKPVLTSTYVNFVNELDARFDDLALGLDPAVTSAVNLPVGAIRWNSALSKDQKWNGSAWVNKTASEVFPALYSDSFRNYGSILSGGGAQANIIVDSQGSSTGAGAYVAANTNGASTTAIGNKSAFTGGIYDSTPTVYGTTTLHVLTGNVSGVFTSQGFSSPCVVSEGASKSAKNVYGLELFSSGSVVAFKIASLPASTAGTYDQVRITGVMGGWPSVTKQPLDVICSNREALTVRVLEGVFDTTNKILFYREADDTISVWSYLGNYRTQGIDITGCLQATAYNAPVSATPTGTLVFDTSTVVPSMAIDTSGNFGIGSYVKAWNDGISSARALEIGGNLPHFTYSDGVGTSYTGTNAWYSGAWRYTHTGESFSYSEGPNGNIWLKAASGNAGDLITYKQLMKIDPTDNLIVGSGTAQWGGTGRGNITVTGSTQAIFALSTGGAPSGYLYGNGTSVTVGAPSGQPIKIDIGGERARFTADGKLLLGTSLTGYQDNNSFSIEPSPGYSVANHASGSAANTGYAYFAYAGSHVGSIRQNGTTGLIVDGAAHLNLAGTIVTAPVVSESDNSASVATTSFVKSQGYAKLNSPALTGTPTAPTQLTSDDSTAIATTEFVKNQGYVTGSVGVGQTWQTVTRESGVTYTNSTNQPIVLVWTVGVYHSSYGSITVGSVQVGYAQGHSPTPIPVQCIAIIPAGETYTPLTNGVIISAVELR